MKMSKQAKVTAKPLLSETMSIVLVLLMLGLVALYFSPTVVAKTTQGSTIYIHISSNRPFGGVLVAMESAPFSPDAFAEGIPIPRLVLPFNCLFEDFTNETQFCRTVFSLTSSTTVHLHGIKGGYYFLRLAAYVPGGITKVDDLVNISGYGTYQVTATYTGSVLNITSLTPGMQVTTPYGS